MNVQQEINPPVRLSWVVFAFGFTTIAVTLVGSLGQRGPSFRTNGNTWFSEENRLRPSKDRIGTERELRHRKKSTKKLGRIVNGDPTGAGKYPFIVALYSTETPNPPEDHPACGASLITPNVALTAAHCIVKIKSAEFGRYDVNDNEGVQFFDNLLRRYHPLYDAATFNYDYALVKFPSEAKDPYLVQLWQTPELPNEMTIMGWGVTGFESETQPDRLLEANVSRFDAKECATNYAPEKITENMFCAANSDEGRDACQGDSGGPIVIRGRNVQLGLVSFGESCADPKFPGVYARIDKGYSWIQETVCTDLDPGYCVNGKLPYVDEEGQATEEICEDTESFIGLGKKMSMRDCMWVGKRPGKRCKWYGDRFCPATCAAERCSSSS